MLRELTIVAILALVLGVVSGWMTQGWRKDKEIATIKGTYEEQRASAESAARRKEQELQHSAEQILRDKNAQIDTINQRLRSSLTGLRSRSERPAAGAVPSAPSTGFGLSGSELARGDAEFLAGFAADAARLEAALKQCEAQYNSIGQ